MSEELSNYLKEMNIKVAYLHNEIKTMERLRIIRDLRLGKYDGTYIYKDITFEFASAISPVFKLYLIKEFQRLKTEENKNIEWNIKRILTKNNYLIHTELCLKNFLHLKIV